MENGINQLKQIKFVKKLVIYHNKIIIYTCFPFIY